MQARAVGRYHLHNVRSPTLGHRFLDTVTNCKSSYTNLCAFTCDLIREDIDLFAWEDIMTTAFNRARNNMPSRASTQGNGYIINICKAYLRGAEAWVNYDVVRKSLRFGRLPRESWRMWQDMFTEANSANSRASRNPRNPLRTASRTIGRALEGVNDGNEARNSRESYTPRARPLRIPASI